jgi:hypothetical protein
MNMPNVTKLLESGISDRELTVILLEAGEFYCDHREWENLYSLQHQLFDLDTTRPAVSYLDIHEHLDLVEDNRMNRDVHLSQDELNEYRRGILKSCE